MKILEKNLKEQEGLIALKVESLNDLWTLYNIISKDDHVSMMTKRRVILKEGTTGERKTMRLTLNVEDVAFHEFSNRLRIKGTILKGPEDFVSYGSYHTFNVEIHDTLEIIKEKWLIHDLEQLKESSQLTENFVMLVIAVESGLATIALITNYSYNQIATIKKTIPGKRYEKTHRNKIYKEFYEEITTVLSEQIKSSPLNLMILCGPGNTRIQLEQFIKEQLESNTLPPIENVHATSGTQSAVLETLKSEKLNKLTKKVKVFQESEKIEKIIYLFSTDPDLIVIGQDEVTQASEKGAIEELLLIDELLRGTSKEHKLQIEKILNNVKHYGGKIYILSSNNSPGQQLKDLGSLVGILRYKW